MAEESTWAELPGILLEDIFCLLSWRDRHTCSQVCRNWYDQFGSPRLWKQLEVKDTTFTYHRHNLYQGYLREVSTHKVQTCLTTIGHYVKKIIIYQNPNFHNLYKFINVFGTFLEFFEEYPMPLLKELQFTFACETIDTWTHEPVVLGTGGRLLETLKHLLGNLKGIEKLVFNHLLLEGKDFIGLLQDFVIGNKDSLKYLEMLNCVKYRHPLTHAALFSKLETLLISPTQLSDTMLLMLAERTNIKKMVIVQDRYTGTAEPLSSKSWWEAKALAPDLRVHLKVCGRVWPDTDILIQPLAPVEAVVYDCCHAQVSTQTVVAVSDEYKTSLRIYAHLALNRKYRSKSFYERADTTLVLLIRECTRLTTLMISERVSTCTLLVIAKECKSLQEFYVRKNAIILKCDWPKSLDWTDLFYKWLRDKSQAYDTVEEEISKILGYQWELLRDKDFLQIKI